MENQQIKNNSSGPAPEPTQSSNITSPDGTTQQPQVISPNLPTTPLRMSDNTQAQPSTERQSRIKPLLIIVVVVVLIAGGAAAAMKLMNKKTTFSNSLASSQTAANSIQWVQYNDPTLGFTFSYPKGWHISDSTTTKEPAGRTIYLGPHAISSDPAALQQQYLNDPELGFYIFNTNPAGNLDNQPISAPDQKVGTITLATGKTSALIEEKFTSYDDTVTLSACPDATCVFKINGKFLSPSIKTLGSAEGLDGHNIDKSGEIYQTELKIWQTLKF